MHDELYVYAFAGISDVAEAYLAATKGASSGSQVSQKSIQEKANMYSENLHADHSTAVGKIQDGLQDGQDSSQPQCLLLEFLDANLQLVFSFLFFFSPRCK